MKKIYFVREELGNVKIGCTEDPTKRRDALQTGNSKRLILLGWFEGTREDEAELHKKFAHIQDTSGANKEWFKPEPELLKAIEDLITNRPEV